ncbi:peptidylprolyl isomerase [Roseomonas sp. CCTCC AB2023176]|uniref:peptidylprolyl isomerase n=1 Tax=Roseomonas sp. CCTCC AB2023176 TaxID=3342640 RepID=UPI0035DA9003
MRRLLLASAALLLALPAYAQAPTTSPTTTPATTPATPPAAAAGPRTEQPTPQVAPATPGPDQNPVVARVEGQEIRLSDVRDAAEALPDELRSAPPAMLYPLIVDQLVAQKAIVIRARAEGLERDPDVQRRIRRAEDETLQQALLRREVEPALTDEALRRRYDAANAGRQPEEEVQARHILVQSEADARAALEEVRRPGADFAEVARRRSSGPGSQQGGDLGFFKRGDMIPEFAEAAFALQPGQISPSPVRTPFGWHVIKVEARRAAPAPTFEETRDTLRQQAFEETVNAAVQRIRDAARVERFNLDGSPLRAPSLLDNASPPPGAPATPSPAPQSPATAPSRR